MYKAIINVPTEFPIPRGFAPTGEYRPPKALENFLFVCPATGDVSAFMLSHDLDSPEVILKRNRWGSNHETGTN